MRGILLLCLLLQAFDSFTQAGVLDQTFSGDGKVITAVGTGDDQAYGIASQPNGKLVVVGTSENGASTDFAIVRYNADGSLDNSFSGDGKLLLDIAGGNDEARAVVILSNGMILVSGFASVGNSIDFAIVLLSSDGKLVNTFSSDGKATIDFSGTDDYCYSMLVFNDKIYLAGSTITNSQEEFAVAVLSLNGLLDTSFDGDGKASIDIGAGPDFGRAIAIQDDGKLVLTGYTGSDFNNDFATVRLLTAGKLDPSFGQDGKIITDIGPNWERAFSVAIQKDQKVVVSGFTFYNTGNDFALVRFLPDGSLDKSFSMDGILVQAIGTRFDEGYAMALQADGKILVTGEAAQPSTDADFGLARFTDAGILDKTFSGDGSVITPMGNLMSEDIAYAIALQKDGKIVIAGEAENGMNLDFAVARYTSGLVINTEQSVSILENARIYPNPVADYFLLNFNLKEDKRLSIELIDSEGKKRQSFFTNYQLVPGAHTLTCKLNRDLMSGTFYVVISTGNQSQILEFVK